MSGGRQRLSTAKEDEARVRRYINKHTEWYADHDGQGLYAPTTRNNMNSITKPKTLLRWWPDLRVTIDGSMLFIDVKGGRKDTGNLSVEKKSLECMIAIQQVWGTPVWYVFDTAGARFRVMTASDMDACDKESVKRTKTNNGSGTPHWLVPVNDGLPSLESMLKKLRRETR